MKWFYVFVCPMETKLTFSPVSAPDRNSRIPHSPILKRSIKLNGKKTSISLEGQFWIGLREIACAENIPLYSLTNGPHQAESFILHPFIRVRSFPWQR